MRGTANVATRAARNTAILFANSVVTVNEQVTWFLSVAKIQDKIAACLTYKIMCMAWQ